MKVRYQSEIRQSQTPRGQYDLEFYKSYNYEESKYFKINHFPSEKKPDYIRWIYKDIDVYSPATYNTLSRYTKVPTLKELGMMLSPQVGKSGVNHRLRKLSAMADELREKEGGELL